MIRVNDGEHRVVHVSVLIAAGKIGEFEFQRLSVRRYFSGHARPVPRVTIVDQCELVRVDVQHRDGMVVLCRVQRCSGFLELVHEDVSPRGHAHRNVQRLNVHLRRYRHVGLHGALPIPREGFHGVEGSLRLGLRR